MKPAEARHRIRTIHHLIGWMAKKRKEEPDKWTPAKWEINRAYLGWGYIPPALLAEAGRPEGQEDSAALSTEELLTYDTYFAIHPSRVLGEEKEATSLLFPVQVKGKVSELKDTLKKLSQQMELLDTELDLGRELSGRLAQRLNSASPSPLLAGLSGLGDLSPDKKSSIQASKAAIERTLEKSALEKNYSKGDLLEFEDIDTRYNSGITTDEKRAWVWYKRTMGEPMTGWEKYFLSRKGKKTRMIVSTLRATLRDTNGRVLRTAPEGTILGKHIQGEFHLEGRRLAYVRTFEGVRLVNPHEVEVQDSPEAYATDKELFDLVKNGALFYLRGELVPYPVYAYGNMYDRELELKKDAEKIEELYGKKVLDNHRKIIAEAKPPLLSVTNPDPGERPVISVLSKFAEDFRIDDFNDNYPVNFDQSYSLLSSFASYLKMLDKRAFGNSTAYNIWEYYIRGKRNPGSYGKSQWKTIKSRARAEGERLFGEFLHNALRIEDQRRIDLHWNRLYNGQSNLAYTRIPIGFTASAKFKQFNFHLRPIQREGVAFINAIRSGIIAYDVGVGKTMTAIVSVAEAITSGRAKRPLIVVPNPTYKKWLGELVGYEDKDGHFVPGVLSYTGIKVNDWFNLSKKYQKGIDPDQPVPENSITLLTYEGFKKIGFSEKVIRSMLVELSNILAQPAKGDQTQRNAEVDYTKYEELVGIGLRGTIYDIDTLGFDKLVIDEAHRCKNIFDGVRKDQYGHRRYDISGASSDLGKKAFFLCNYVQRTYGGNVVLLTATPFTNSPLEIFSMLSLVGIHSLQSLNIRNIHEFFMLFVQEKTEMVVDINGEVKEKTVIKGFNNRMVLQKLIYNHINYKTGEEAGIRRPCKINLPRTREVVKGIARELPPNEQSLTYLAMTPEQEKNQKRIITMLDRARGPGFLNLGALFRALNQSLNNALSPFLSPDTGPPVDHIEFVEESPKILYAVRCIESVRKYHQDRKEPVSGQVIYANRGKDFFPMIKQYLIEESGFKSGVKWGRRTFDEVEIISSGMGESRKEAIKEAFLEGVIKVIIGTASIREGIDLQKRSTVLYNLYPDWNPTDIRQLEGRVWRQGNRHGYVRVVMPLVQDSMDVFVFQKLEEKTARINDIWFRADRGNVLDLESLDPQEIKLALISDPAEIAEMLQKEAIARVKQDMEFKQSDVNVLRELEDVLRSYQSYRQRITTELNRIRTRLENSPSIKNPNVSELLKSMSDYQQASIKKEIRLYQKLQEFDAIHSPTDKEVVKMARYVNNNGDGSLYFLPYFIEAIAKMRSAERTILKDRGLSAEDKIEPVIEKLEEEINDAKRKIEDYQNPAYRNLLLQDINLKKSKLKIAGSTVDKRVADFSALNYLMDYHSSEVDSGDCFLPGPGTRRDPRSALDDELALAKALQLQLQLRLRLRRRKTPTKQQA